MSDNEINVLEIMMDMQQRLARIEEQTKKSNKLEKDVARAISLAEKHEKDLEDMKESRQWIVRTLWVAILLPVFLMFVEKFILKM